MLRAFFITDFLFSLHKQIIRHFQNVKRGIFNVKVLNVS